MAAAKPAMDKIHPCAGDCGRMTRPARMQPLASVHTLPRAGGGLCTRCYAVKRRADRAAAVASGALIVAKAASKRPIAKKPEVIEEENARHTAAVLSRFEADRRARLARQARRVSLGQSMVRI